MTCINNIILRVLKNIPQHRSMKLRANMFNECCSLPHCSNFTSFLDQNCFIAIQQLFSFSFLQPDPPHIASFIKLWSNASTENVALTACAWKKHQQQHKQQTLRHCFAEDKNQTSRKSKNNETCLTKQQRLGPHRKKEQNSSS